MEKKNLRDSYKFYKQTAEHEKVDIKIYLSIVLGFIKCLMGKVFEGYDVNLSSNNSLGTIGIRGTKVKPKISKNGKIMGLAPDWVKTNELWNNNPEAKQNKELIFCMNEHTNGIRYRINWFKRGITSTNGYLYSLIFTKGPSGNKRKVRDLVISGKEYLVNTN